MREHEAAWRNKRDREHECGDHRHEVRQCSLIISPLSFRVSWYPTLPTTVPTTTYYYHHYRTVRLFPLFVIIFPLLCSRSTYYFEVHTRQHSISRMCNQPRRLVAGILTLAQLFPVAAQVRCNLASIRQQDGSFSIRPSCEHLLLFGENIGDEGVRKLVTALGVAGRVQFLDLWSNGIGPNGAQACVARFSLCCLSR